MSVFVLIEGEGHGTSGDLRQQVWEVGLGGHIDAGAANCQCSAHRGHARRRQRCRQCVRAPSHKTGWLRVKPAKLGQGSASL